jgi:tetratricopeptide (TPR) repeat protein
MLRDAAIEFRENLRLLPDDMDARKRLAEVLENMGNDDGAIEEYKELLKYYPFDVPGKIGLGTAYARKRMFDVALKELYEASGIEPDNQEIPEIIEKVKSANIS